jgi:uncharacterized membrane protein
MDFLSQTEWWAALVRWLHIISGIMWIGHLWYFNFTQTPTVPKIPAELRPAIVRYILPEALFWFRWGAVATLGFGLILAWLNPGFPNELISGLKLGIGDPSPHGRNTAIGWGMWIGFIMFLNVWILIWPNQQKVIGLVSATPDEVNAARRVAGLASRVNTMLSIPMLYAMVFAAHRY